MPSDSELAVDYFDRFRCVARGHLGMGNVAEFTGPTTEWVLQIAYRPALIRQEVALVVCDDGPEGVRFEYWSVWLGLGGPPSPDGNSSAPAEWPPKPPTEPNARIEVHLQGVQGALLRMGIRNLIYMPFEDVCGSGLDDWSAEVRFSSPEMEFRAEFSNPDRVRHRDERQLCWLVQRLARRHFLDPEAQATLEAMDRMIRPVER